MHLFKVYLPQKNTITKYNNLKFSYHRKRQLGNKIIYSLFTTGKDNQKIP